MKHWPILALSIALLTGCATHPHTRDSNAQTHTPACAPANADTIAQLFDRWNQSLQTGQPKAVVAHYATRSILLPTVSGTVRTTPEEKEAYFEHFLASQPVGTITERQIDIGCNTATDSGLYTFLMRATGEEVKARYTYAYQWKDGQWLITHHHSSVVPDP